MDEFDDSIEIDGIDADNIESPETSDDIGVTDNTDIQADNIETEETVYLNEDNEVIEATEANDVTVTNVSIEINVEKEDVHNIETEDSLGKSELQEYLEKESPYSAEVNEYISSSEELQVYKEAGLVEQNIDGRTCLIREDLDLNYVDKQSGLTNAELIAKGRSPYDSKTGERIELHHIGQDFNAPFAELKSFSEHDLYSKTLHKSEMDSWRRDPEKVSEYGAQRKAHWKTRSEEEL